MIPVLIAFLAGCGGDRAVAPQLPTAERSFQLIYQADVQGELEPCG